MRSMPKIAAIISTDQNDAGQDRRPDRDQPETLESEGDALASRRLLDRFDVDLTFGVLFEHALSSSHVGLIICSLGSVAR